MTCRVFGYELQFERDEYGGWIVTVPQLPGCITYGESIDSAKANAMDEIDAYIGLLDIIRECGDE